MPVEKLADPDGIRDEPGGTIITAEARAEAERCAVARAEAILTRDGAQLRSDLYDNTLIAGLAIGTVGLMLAKILNGEIEAKDAKQAIDIAKIALMISDKVTGETAADEGDENTPTGRAAKIARKDELVAQLRERANEAIALEGRSAGRGDVDLSEFEDDDDHVAPSHLRAVR